jgi:hypothetical protein
MTVFFAGSPWNIDRIEAMLWRMVRATLSISRSNTHSKAFLRTPSCSKTIIYTSLSWVWQASLCQAW